MAGIAERRCQGESRRDSIAAGAGLDAHQSALGDFDPPKVAIELRLYCAAVITLMAPIIETAIPFFAE